MNDVRAFEAESGLAHLSGPGHVDVDAQIIELAKLDPAHVDPRLLVAGLERITQSDALIVNIDYPLGHGRVSPARRASGRASASCAACT